MMSNVSKKASYWEALKSLLVRSIIVGAALGILLSSVSFLFGERNPYFYFLLFAISWQLGVIFVISHGVSKRFFDGDSMHREVGIKSNNNVRN